MAPVLKEPARGSISSPFQEPRIVRPEPREQRHEVRSGRDVDRVDLKLRQPTRHRLHITHRDWPLPLGHPKALRSQRDPSRLGLAQPFPSHNQTLVGSSDSGEAYRRA